MSAGSKRMARLASDGRMNAKVALTLVALLAASPLPAKDRGLTVRTGESWIFAIQGGQPVRARKVDPSVRVARGQVLVTVRSMMGTTMTISSNNPDSYTYKAEL